MTKTAGRRIRVLVIDDDHLQLAAVRDALEAGGYEVDTRDSALGTSQHIRRHPPDVVLLEVRMPALSGDRVAELIKSSGATALVVLHSAIPAHELHVLANQCGAVGSISKGLTRGQFLSELESLVAQPLRRRRTG